MPVLIALAPQHNSSAAIRLVPLVLPQNAEERLSFSLFYLSYVHRVFTLLGYIIVQKGFIVLIPNNLTLYIA
jgi:hypothetical protein